ncbi:hypothetical protein GCM10027592_42520 [Spirosoma flavus]
MKHLWVFWLLLPVSGLCQDAEQMLRSYASLLANNRTAQKRFFYDDSREQKRLDTLSASAENYRFRAMNYLWHQQYEQAEIWLEKTAMLYPREHGFVGEQYIHLRDYQRALAHFDAYDALTPNFNDIVGYNPVSYMRGLVHRAMGNHQKAIEQFSVGIDSLAKKHGAEWVNYKHFVSRAVSYIATGQAEKALIDLDKATKNFNRSALAQFQRGRALLQLGRVDEARSAFQDASFFLKALRAERNGDYQEDDYNPVYELEIDEALTNLKNQRP